MQGSFISYSVVVSGSRNALIPDTGQPLNRLTTARVTAIVELGHARKGCSDRQCKGDIPEFFSVRPCLETISYAMGPRLTQFFSEPRSWL